MMPGCSLVRTCSEDVFYASKACRSCFLHRLRQELSGSRLRAAQVLRIHLSLPLRLETFLTLMPTSTALAATEPTSGSKTLEGYS